MKWTLGFFILVFIKDINFHEEQKTNSFFSEEQNSISIKSIKCLNFKTSFKQIFEFDIKQMWGHEVEFITTCEVSLLTFCCIKLMF